MKTYKFFGLLTILALLVAAVPIMSVGAAGPVAVNKGDITLSSNGATDSGNFPETWDLTAGDMTISFTYDGNGLVDNETAQWQDHAWAELGMRDTTTTSNFNPGGGSGGKGIWLATDYDEWQTLNTFSPDPLGAPSLDLDDKLILQRTGGHGEGDYDLPSNPPAPGNNHRVWWDRDGVDPWQNSQTANTGGLYNIVMTLHATSATTGTAYMTINGLSQGFETDGNWNTIELTPAGITFSGDMTHMQVFYGLYGYGATHSVAFKNIQVTGCLATYTVNASVTGGHGSVAPATQTVDWNTSASISITPELGYHIASITDNGNAATIANPYVISNVTDDHTVVVTFAPTVPETKDQCKNDGWISVRRADGSPFKNQGDCIQYVNTGK